MKIVILYSQYDESRAKAQELASRLQGKTVDLIEVYGSELGQAMKDLLEPREFPCLILVQDYLQGNSLEDLEYVEAALAEQQDIEEREFFKRETDFLPGKLYEAKQEGKKELEPVIDAMTSLLIEGGII